MDVDIDVIGSFNPLEVFPDAIQASQFHHDKLTAHPCGVYFQTMPQDPITGLAAITHDKAGDLNFFKIDFLHVHVYDHFSSHDEIVELLTHEPDWTLLEIPSVVEKLFQVAKHHSLLAKVKPRSVIELADCLALIRPQKQFLLNYYLQNRNRCRQRDLYRREGVGFAFKKSHAVAYALIIVLQLHLVKHDII